KMASVMLLATRLSAVEKKPRLRMITRRSSSERRLLFRRAMSSPTATSVGIQWLEQQSRCCAHAQPYLSGISWLTSTSEHLIRRFASADPTATRGAASTPRVSGVWVSVIGELLPVHMIIPAGVGFIPTPAAKRHIRADTGFESAVGRSGRHEVDPYRVRLVRL